MNQIDNYIEMLYIQEELTQLNEFELKAVIAKLSPESKTKELLHKIRGSIDKNNPIKSLKKVKSMLNFLPSVSLKNINNYISKKETNFNSLKKTANVVVKNSLPGVSAKAIDISSSFLAVASMITRKGEKISAQDNLKKNIKNFVTRTRKFSGENEEKSPLIPKEDIPDLAVAWVIVVMSTTLAIGLGMGVYTFLVTFSTYIPSMIAIVTIIILVVLMMKDLDSI